jgi:adenine-specific DNA-methyltransferase
MKFSALRTLFTTKKTGGMGEAFIDNVSDYLVWIAKQKSKAKFNALFLPKEVGVAGGARYNQLQLASGATRGMTKNEKESPELIPEGAKPFLGGPMTSETASESTTFKFTFQARELSVRKGGWKTGETGMQRLIRADRLKLTKEFVNYKMFVDDFPAFVLTNLWSDTMGTAEQDKSYVVQTTTKVIERCLLMTTDPGDLVLDPTCGSGSTAFVAEKWGRRWITCDTSRVAVTLAKQRLMTASYDYFELKYPHEGLRGGFIYKTVPHVTLKSIANNPEIDTIYEAMHPAIEQALADLNAAIDSEPLRSGKCLSSSRKMRACAREPFERFHAARQAMQKKMDASIAAHADQETLVRPAGYFQEQTAHHRPVFRRGRAIPHRAVAGRSATADRSGCVHRPLR